MRSTCSLIDSKPLYATMFPQVTSMAATFNLTLIGEMAAQMATEARAVNNILRGKPDAKLGGGLNYWGRMLNTMMYLIIVLPASFQIF